MVSEVLSAEEPRDVTFRNYSSQQASDYAEGRIGYSPSLIDFILNHHMSTNGKNETVLDVGCGPGTATKLLAPHFDIAYGVDPGASMIETATSLGGQSRSGAPIIYKLSTAEDIDNIDGIPHSSVDMITAATCAHWFEMPKFWAAAARILKPGGTVAIWTIYRKPEYPKNTKLDTIFEDFRKFLEPYRAEGTQITQDGYVNLVMPWDDPSTASLYSRDTFVRHELPARENVATGTDKPKAEEPSEDKLEKQLQKLERLLVTMGSVNRWQTENPELVGTKDDCVKVVLNKVREAAESGESIDLSALAAERFVALLLVKRN